MTDSMHGSSPMPGEILTPLGFEPETAVERAEFVQERLLPVFGTSDLNSVSFLMTAPTKLGETYAPYHSDDLGVEFTALQGSVPVYRPTLRQLTDTYSGVFGDRLGLVVRGLNEKSMVYKKLDLPENAMAEAVAGALLRFSERTGLSAREVFGSTSTTPTAQVRFTMLRRLAEDTNGEIILGEPEFKELGQTSGYLNINLRDLTEAGVLEQHEVPPIKYRVERRPSRTEFRGPFEKVLAGELAALYMHEERIRPCVSVDLLYRIITSKHPTYAEKPEGTVRAQITYALRHNFFDAEVVSTKPHITDARRKPYMSMRNRYYYSFASSEVEEAFRELAQAERAIVEGDIEGIVALQRFGRELVDDDVRVKAVLKRFKQSIGHKLPHEFAVTGETTHKKDAKKKFTRAIIQIIKDNPGVESGEIAAQLNVDKRRVVTTIGKLSARGVVEGHKPRPGKENRSKRWFIAEL